jgi:hypothetical protein
MKLEFPFQMEIFTLTIKAARTVNSKSERKLQGSLCSMFSPPLYISPTHDVKRDAPMISLAEC